MQDNRFNYSGSYYQPPTAPQSTMDLRYAEYYRIKRKQEKKEITTAGIFIGGAIILMLVLEVIIAGSLPKLGIKELYDKSSLMQNCFNMLAVHFPMLLVFGMMALCLKKRFVSPVVPVKNIGAAATARWVGLGMGVCIGASVLTNLIVSLVKQLGYELTQPDLLEVDSVYTCVVIVFSTAIVPAIIEEFSMRCCSLGVLRKHGKGFAVFAVSIVFGLLHGNVIQFIFAFLLGLVFGYITIRTDSVIPAMLIHGFNNGISVINDIVKYAFDEKAAETVVVMIYCIWIALAVVSLVALCFKKELLPPKQPKKPKEPYALNFAEKCACLIPGFFIPFVILILLTTQYIQPVS